MIYGGTFRYLWQIVVLGSSEINDRLLAIGGRIKKKYMAELTAISEPYRKVCLNPHRHIFVKCRNMSCSR